jgi:uncharacterized membrane protein YdfJ with MMPL/SSD domain
MSSLTRWVLAHKRVVVIGWIVLTIAGIAAAGPASKGLKAEFSVPDKESWKTNVEIAERYGSDLNGSTPLVPVVTLPAGKTVSSPGVFTELKHVDERLRAALPGRGSPPTTRLGATPSSPRTIAPRSRSSTRTPIPARSSGRTPRPSSPLARRSRGLRSRVLPCT